MTVEPDIEVVDVDHVALPISDIERSLEFYHEILGLDLRDRDRFKRGDVPYIAVVTGSRQLHLMPTDDPVEAAGDHVCLLIRSREVDSCEEMSELLDHLQSQGVKVEEGEPRERYGSYGRAWAAYVRDPDGHRIELKIH